MRPSVPNRRFPASPDSRGRSTISPTIRGQSKARARQLRGASFLWFVAVSALAIITSHATFEMHWAIGLIGFVSVNALARWVSPEAGRKWVEAARHLVPNADPEAALSTGRPLVAYLRPFRLDGPAGQVGTHGGNFFRTEEQQLERAFSGFGELVAVDRPKDALPPVGATRLYLPQDWREKVVDLVQKSALVLIGAGTEKNVQWEIELVVRTYDPLRTILLLPGDESTYE